MLGPREALARLRARYPGRNWWPVDRPYHGRVGTDARFEVILGAFLAQNTSWAGAEAALANLKAGGLFEPGRVARIRRVTLQRAIRPAGYFRQKAAYIQDFARYLTVEWKSDLDRGFRRPLPELRGLLLERRGIGPETADSILVYAAHRASFIVDAYTRRLTRRLGLGTGREPYEELGRLWSAGLAKNWRTYAEAHASIVEHAKRTCTARRPRCPECPLEPFCPRVGVADSP